MPEAAATTTRPSRTRTAKPAAAKATPAKAAPAKAAAPAAKAEVTEVTRFKVELEHLGSTARYEKFGAPDSYKGTVVGTMYCPIGTERVAILVIGAGDKGDDA